MAKRRQITAQPSQRCQKATRWAVPGIDLKWPSTSICDIRPGHSLRGSIIGSRQLAACAKLLNECKFFPYNQLSLRRKIRAAEVAQGVHFGTGTTHPEMQPCPTHRKFPPPPSKNCPPTCSASSPPSAPCPINT